MLKVSLDLDGTIFDWSDHYISKFGLPKTDFEITKNVKTILKKDKEFWLSQPLIRSFDFEPSSYCTARIISKNWIKEQLFINNLPPSPIYQVRGISLSKVPQLKRSKCHVHVDDSLKVFIDCNLHGIPCLLIDSPNNQEWGPIGRIYSLNIDEIEDTYNLFVNTVFNNFKELVR